MDRIRIAAVAWDLAGGGADKVLSDVFAGIDKSVFEPHIIILNKLRIDPGDRFEGVEFHELRCSRARYSMFALQKSLKHIKPELVWCLTPYIASTTYLCRKVFHLDFKLIYEVSCTKFKMRADIRYVEKQVINGCEGIILLNNWMAGNLAKVKDVEGERLKVIANPVDITHLRELASKGISHRFQSDAKMPVILSLGRLEKQKNHIMLIDAFSKILKKREVKLVIIGTGSQKKTIQEYCSKKGVEASVDLIGYLENPYTILKKSCILAVSSDFEGVPIVILEAHALGVPIVSTSYEGYEESIQGDKDALVSPVGEPEAFSNNLLRVIENDDLKADLISSGLERINNFSNEKIIRSYEDFFKKINGLERSK